MTSKREKDLKAAKTAREAEKRAASEAARRQRFTIVGGIAAAVLLIAGGFFVVQAFADDDAPATTTATQAATPSASSQPTSTASAVDCAKPGDLQTKAQEFPDGPEGVSVDRFQQGSTVGLNVTTNCGDLELSLTKDTPRTLESLVFLANTGAPICEPKGADCSGENPTGTVKQIQGFWDNTTCHRLTTEGIFVLQCGDPTGTGTGGPGYSTPDENLDAIAQDFEDAGNGQVIYPRGTIAMANSGPNTNGSQFFIVYKDSPLAPAYTVVGQVTKGLDIIDAVADGGVVSGGIAPAQPLELKKVLSFERTQVQQ